jgi:mannose-6-phosphate isomerase-like protein (cupin superfamily)
MATHKTLNAEQEALWYLGSQKIIQAIGEQADHAVHLSEHVLPAGTHVYAHRLQDEDEGIYVTEGEATFSCGEKVMSVTAGTLLFLPQNVHQHFEVGKSASFRYLTWMTATGFAHHALQIGKPGQALVLSPPPFASQERIQQLAILLRNATTPSLEEQLAILLRNAMTPSSEENF